MGMMKDTTVSDNNRLTCGKCAFVWLEYRGLPPDKLTCPRCNANVIRKGLVQSGKKNQPKSALDELYEVLEFASGDGIHQWREYKQ